MGQLIITLVLVAGAIMAAIAMSIGFAGALHLTSRRPHGYAHLIFYAMILLVGLTNLLSDRELTGQLLVTGAAAVAVDAVRPPLLGYIQPALSLLILIVTVERIVSYFIKPPKDAHAPMLLLTAFIVYWLGSVAASALFGAHPYMTHDYVYPLVIGIAVLLASGIERDLAFRAARDGLFAFLTAGLLLVPFKPDMVMDWAYNQGLIPGLPRMAGLANHAVSLGMLVQVALLCLLASPYRRRWLNLSAWAVGLLVLFLAQSKTAWISFALCTACVVMFRSGPSMMRRANDPNRPEFGVSLLTGLMLLISGVGLVILFGDLGSRVSNFFNSAEGAQLASLTGRDLIWEIALDEWRRNPVFGYGPTIWDAAFRTSIGMANATNAHNQFMDTLSRSGTVGAASLVIYASVLLVLSVRYARVSGGLSLALFLGLAIRSVSEVPLLLFGYGPEMITHSLLLMTLAAAASLERQARPKPSAAAHARTFTPPLRPAHQAIGTTKAVA